MGAPQGWTVMKRLVEFAIAATLATSSASAAADRAKSATPPPASHVSCKGAPNEIRVVVRNVKKNQGLITADLFRNDELAFLKKEGRVGRVRVAAKSPVTVFCIAAPTAALHALALYQDKDANLKFDKNSLGLPNEPYGVSNNPKMRFGPPKIGEALFPVAADGAIIEIGLKN